MKDYLYDIVSHSLISHVSRSQSLKGLGNVKFASILPYFPLDAIQPGRMAYSAWPIVDGQLTPTNPVKLSTTHFSRSYSGFLSATNLSGPGTSTLVYLAKEQTHARNNVNAPSVENGGLYVDHNGTQGADSYVPGYTATWDNSPGLPNLVIKVDAWRPDSSSQWQERSSQKGGQRLKAKLVYSDFRVVVLTPTRLSDDTGWYSDTLLNGMRDGEVQGVTFSRTSGFGDEAAFIRAAAYVMVGRVQFKKTLGSSVQFDDLLTGDTIVPMTGPPKNFSLVRIFGLAAKARKPLQSLSLGENIMLPHGDLDGISGFLGLKSLATSWDTGNIYETLEAGFLVCAIPDAPFSSARSQAVS